MGSLETRTREIYPEAIYRRSGRIAVVGELPKRRQSRVDAAAKVARAIQAGKDLAAATEQREAIIASAEPHEEAGPLTDQQGRAPETDGEIPVQPAQASRETTRLPA